MIKTCPKRCFPVGNSYLPVGKIARLDFLKVLCFLFLVSVVKHKKFLAGALRSRKFWARLVGKSMTDPIKLESLFIRIKGKLLIFLQLNNATLFKHAETIFRQFYKG